MPGGKSDQIELTADLIAQAIVASARSYGDDPARAMAVQSGPRRRCITPAVLGLSIAADLPMTHVARVIGVTLSNVNRSRARGGEAFERALRAARRAVEDAIWRSDAVALDVPRVVAKAAVSVVAPTAEASFDRLRTALVHKPPMLAAGAARRRVREALQAARYTAPGLVAALGLSEAQVRQALRELRDAGEAAHDGAAGWREQLWGSLA